MAKHKRTLYILLMLFPGGGPRFMQFMTGFYYTHASIGLEEDMNTFYSFVKTGFIVEDINRYISKPDRAPFPCQLYTLSVSQKTYDAVKRILEFFIRFHEMLCYTNLGLILSLFRIPYCRRHNYFCSHFVAEVLKHSRAVKLKKASHRYLPGDFTKLQGIDLAYTGDLKAMIDFYGITSKPAVLPPLKKKPRVTAVPLLTPRMPLVK